MPHKHNHPIPRRKTLIAVTAVASVPVWSKPLVKQVLLPVHANTTDDTGSKPPEVTTTSKPGITTTSEPGNTTTTTTTTIAPLPPSGLVQICHANLQNCDDGRVVRCGDTINLGPITSNAIKVTVGILPDGTEVDWEGCQGGQQCGPVYARGGIATVSSQTGNRTYNTTLRIKTTPECVFYINWTASLVKEYDDTFLSFDFNTF